MFRGLILLFFCSAAIKADETQEMMAQLHNTCVAETGVTEDLLAGTQSGNFPEEESLKCYFKCIMKTIGVMDEDGNVDAEVALAMMPPHIATDTMTAALRKCGALAAGPDHCTTAFLMYKCLQTESPNEYSVP